MLISHHFICPDCKSQNNIAIKHPDRGEYVKHHGDELALTCDYCQKTNTIHINKVFAEGSRKLILMAFLIAIAIIVLLFLISSKIYILSFALFLLPIFVMYMQNDLVKTFNHYRVKSK